MFDIVKLGASIASIPLLCIIIYLCYRNWRNGKCSNAKMLGCVTACLIFLILILAILPRAFYSFCPRVWGVVEARTQRDMTGFAFSKYGGEGPCRIDNTIETLRYEGNCRLIFGYINWCGKEKAHIWGLKGSRIIDIVCPKCTQRRVLAVVNPYSLAIEWSAPYNEKESKDLEKGVNYLRGFIPTAQERGIISNAGQNITE